ncbi:hypothetical protein [Actinoplanes sp. RD1]|uniref:hypothetical protein n=1 Tax=Actinoplanes sp. RD1 TaxID=3064538 RepID=UPI002740F6DA|nr:hypothetical protein [Actinoplanes sp. RD1]
MDNSGSRHAGAVELIRTRRTGGGAGREDLPAARSDQDVDDAEVVDGVDEDVEDVDDEEEEDADDDELVVELADESDLVSEDLLSEDDDFSALTEPERESLR